MNRLPDSARLTGALADFQAGFAARIRDPEGIPLQAGVPERRMQVYEELLFNNLKGFLLSCYPISRDILGESRWNEVARAYFKQHRCETPLFREIPKEFLQWLEGKVEDLFPDLPFLYEFMHYEWLELAVTVAADELGSQTMDSSDDLMDAEPVFNPTAQLACYHYPVHRIGPDFLPQQPDGQLYCFLLYRDHDDQVQFIELNPVTARLVEVLQQSAMTGREALMQIAEEINHPDSDSLVLAGAEQLEGLRRSGVLMGTRYRS